MEVIGELDESCYNRESRARLEWVQQKMRREEVDRIGIDNNFEIFFFSL